MLQKFNIKTKNIAAVILIVSSVLNAGHCQEQIHALVGENAVLPCFYDKPARLPAKVSVFYRDRDDRHLADIIDGKWDLLEQNSQFKNRVSNFPDLYSKGNFSIMLKEVRLSDSGPYSCHIPSVTFDYTVTLNVTVRRNESGTDSTTGGEGGGGGSVGGGGAGQGGGGSSGVGGGGAVVRSDLLRQVLCLVCGQSFLFVINLI